MDWMDRVKRVLESRKTDGTGEQEREAQELLKKGIITEEEVVYMKKATEAANVAVDAADSSADFVLDFLNDEPAEGNLESVRNKLNLRRQQIDPVFWGEAQILIRILKVISDLDQGELKAESFARVVQTLIVGKILQDLHNSHKPEKGDKE